MEPSSNYSGVPGAANCGLPGSGRSDVIPQTTPASGTNHAIKGRSAMQGTLDLARRSEQSAAREKAYSTPIEDFNPGDPERFRDDTFWPFFERLRKEDP